MSTTDLSQLELIVEGLRPPLTLVILTIVFEKIVSKILSSQ